MGAGENDAKLIGRRRTVGEHKSVTERRLRADCCVPGSAGSSLGLPSRLLRRGDLLAEYPWLTRNSFRYMKKLEVPPPFFRLGREEVIFEDEWMGWLQARSEQARS
jgi:hypothetical protein